MADGMTPTDELRARLDERGIEYETPTSTFTVAHIGDIKYRFLQYRRCGEPALDKKLDGKIFAETEWLTPEQAIAATVGAGTCKRIYHPNRITKTCTCSNCGYGASDERWAYCPKCGHKYVHGEVEEQWKRVGRKVAE